MTWRMFMYSAHRGVPCLLLVLLLLPPPAPGSSQATEEIEIAADRAWFGYRSKIEESGPERRGLRVFEVTPEGPADLAGLRAGDLILAISGNEITAKNDLEMVLASDQFKAETGYSFTVQRAGETFSLKITGLAISAQQRQRLAEWIHLARKRLEEEGELVFCDGELRPPIPGSMETSPFWQQLLQRTRQLEVESVLRVERRGSVWIASNAALGLAVRQIELDDLLPGFARLAQDLQDGANLEIRMSYDPAARTYRIGLLEN